jgi:hypothetical protein
MGAAMIFFGKPPSTSNFTAAKVVARASRMSVGIEQYFRFRDLGRPSRRNEVPVLQIKCP